MPWTRTFWLDGPGGDRLQAATVGSGRDAAVFVHQSGTQGLPGRLQDLVVEKSRRKVDVWWWSGAARSC
jgi:hypothetical protein